MNCCKLYLVPEEVINSWKANQRRLTVDYPDQTQITQLDTSMGQILKDDTSSYAKEKLHNQELGKYLNLRKSPPPEPVPKPKANLLVSIPKSHMAKASGILQYLEEDEDVEWDAKNQVYIKGRKIEGSNVTDLMHRMVRKRKTVPDPEGYQELLPRN